MKIESDKNYVILNDNIDNAFMEQFKEYPIIENLGYIDLKKKIEFFSSKTIVFRETFYYLKEEEKEEILELLIRQKINYIIITSNIEDVLYANNLVVYKDSNIVLEGSTKEVLKKEKDLKKLGYGLPFAVDLSTQLNYYDIFQKVYYDIPSLVEDLWNW